MPYDRATRQLRNRQPHLPDYRIRQHGHTSPADGGALGLGGAGAGAVGGGSSGGSGATGSLAVTDGSVTVGAVTAIDFTSGAAVADLGSGVAGVSVPTVAWAPLMAGDGAGSWYVVTDDYGNAVAVSE